MNKHINDMSDEEFFQYLNVDSAMKIHSPEEILKLRIKREIEDKRIAMERLLPHPYGPGRSWDGQ